MAMTDVANLATLALAANYGRPAQRSLGIEANPLAAAVFWPIALPVLIAIHVTRKVRKLRGNLDRH